jgi:hypothetical protein
LSEKIANIKRSAQAKLADTRGDVAYASIFHSFVMAYVT